MAFNAKNISPIDFKKDYAVGVNLPFSGPAVFYSNYTTKESTKYNLNNFFLTNIGERYLFPSFGGNLRDFIFEQNDNISISSLKEIFEISLEEYFPQILVEELEMIPNEELHQLIIRLSYIIRGTGIDDQIEFKFE
tara:strand:+ start:172 stop:579 length:408 start_codon:yes stop_codon:yes gene_type:complete